MPQSFFIAVPGDTKGVGIFGFGKSEKEALDAAYAAAGHGFAVVEYKEGILDPSTESWQVVNPLNGHTLETFDDESAARDYAVQCGFIAPECTQRLHDYVDVYGAPARWEVNDQGLQDLELDTDLVEEIVDQVMEGVDENVTCNKGADYDVPAKDMINLYAEDYSEDLEENPRLEEAVVAELAKRLAQAQADHLEEMASNG